MSRIESKPEPKWICWDCGAVNWADARKCWLCHRRDWKPREIEARAGRAVPEDEPPPPLGNRANRTATVVASVVSATLISVAVFFFVTVVLPLVVFCVVVVSLMIALYQFCSALGGQPH